MKSKLLALLFIALLAPLHADTASHRKAAGEILDLAGGGNTMQAGALAFLEPMLQNLRQNGLPEEKVQQMAAAFKDWIEQDIKFDEVKSAMIDLYVREFSEEELKQILAFYKTPAGAKALTKLPLLMQEGVKIGADYAKTKEGALMERLKKVMPTP